LRIEQQTVGDAALEYKNSGFSVSSGIHQADNRTYKICSTPNLTGTTYNAPDQLFRIHTTANKKGITDINHQSRVRSHMIMPSGIPFSVWTVLIFQQVTFDEHAEYNPTNGVFIAREDGYYQVNARVEYNPSETFMFTPNGYVSIAIYKNSTIYAQGNNLQITLSAMSQEVLYNNNAPNVSDVLWLQAGDMVDIRTFQSYTMPPAPIVPNHEKTFFSIHKIS
jgi:hypothetical protein